MAAAAWNGMTYMVTQTMSAMTASKQRIKKGQRAWKYLRDANAASVQDLAKVAIEDGKTRYTYGLMFRAWDQYASVFSALGMTGERQARVGILGSTCAEVSFSFYGLNMVGAEVSIIPTYSALMPRKVLRTIRDENLTDFIVTDDFAQANFIHDLFAKKESLGLHNVIVLHVPVAGVTVNPLLTAAQEAKYAQIKSWYGPACMDNLLALYSNHPICYAPEESHDASAILHTSGSTTGTGKPVALSDQALNAAAAAFYRMDDLELPWDNLVTAVIVDLSNAYSMVDQMHIPFALGATVVFAPGGILNPWFYRAIPEHDISFLFTVSAMFEHWIKLHDTKELDFSSLRTVVLGGAAVSAPDKRRFHQFMREHGAGDVTLLNGYGISELGGACCLSTRDLDDEAIGHPIPGVAVRLYDDERGKFLAAKDLPCEGVMYLNAPSLATPELDGKQTFEVKTIGRRSYVCTNDLVRMDVDGKLTFLGRANRYFLNEEGRKYESGRVETEIARQSGIESCCVAPVYIKTTHDNIPMLCVKVLSGTADPVGTICKALRQVFLVEKTLGTDNLPVRVLIARELPRNGNGKVDLYKIGRGEVEGNVYTVETVRTLGKATNFRLDPYEEGPADMIKEVFDGISAELKSSLPGHNNKGEAKMNGMADMFNGFNAMNNMGKQMMEGVMGQANSAQGGTCQGFCGMPDMQQMSQMMGMMGMMPNAQDMAQNAAQTMLPTMQQQMTQMMGLMTQMNQTALNMMQKMFEQNCAMMNQFMETANKMAGVDEPAPKEAAEESQPETEE